MRKLLVLIAAVIFLTFSLSIGISIGSDTLGTIDSTKGSVTLIRAGSSIEVTDGMALQKDDLIKTESDASVTVIFNCNLTSTLTGEKEMTIDDLYMKSKLDALKGNIKKPAADIAPAKIETVTIGGTRGTEQDVKKSKSLKNDHYWDEKVE